MARKKLRDFRVEATREQYEVELDSGEVVTFLDPNRLATASAFQLAVETDPKRQLELLLTPSDFTKLWEELKYIPTEETGKLLEDVMEHYGADATKS